MADLIQYDSAPAPSKTEFEALSEQVTSLNSNLQSQITALNTAIKKQINDTKKVILIGDSYGIDNNMWTGWQTAFKNLNAYLVFSSAIGGSGVKGDPNVDSFLTQLQSLESTVTAPDEVTDIVLMGGYNDASLSYSEGVLLAEMGYIVAYCRNTYKNARIHYGFIAVSYRSDGMQNALNIYREIFARICNKFMVHFIPNAWCILLNRSLLYMDKSNANWGFHPNTAGGAQIAEHLSRYLTSGYSDVRYSEVISSIGKASFHNGEVTLTLSDNYPFYTMIPAGIYAYNTWADIVDLDAKSINLLWGTYDEGIAYESWAYLYELTDSGVPVTWVKIRLHNKKIQIKNLTHGVGLTLANDGYIYANGFHIPAEFNFS